MSSRRTRGAGGTEARASEGPPAFEMSTAAHEARLDRAQIDGEDFGDFFIAESFYIAEHDDGLERLRQLADSRLHLIAQLSVRCQIERGFVLVDECVLEMKRLRHPGRRFPAQW